MNDLQTLHEAWGAPEAPTRNAYTQARAALLQRATTRRRRRFGVRIGVVAAAAATTLAAVAVAENLGGTGPDVVPVAAAAVLEEAAVAAETKPFTAPRDDQWIYTEDRFTTLEGNAEVQRSWRRADGGGIAGIDDNGKLRVTLIERLRKGRRPAPPLFEGYRALAALPTEPQALRRWAYERARNTTGGGMNDDGDVFLIFNHMLRGNVLPPKLEAAIFRVLKQLPGVTVLDTVDVLGRPAIALGLGTSDWLHEELLLDKETYTYRGERSTVTRDATIDPFKAGNPRGEVKKGSKVVVARVLTAIVDEPGQRP